MGLFRNFSNAAARRCYRPCTASSCRSRPVDARCRTTGLALRRHAAVPKRFPRPRGPTPSARVSSIPGKGRGQVPPMEQIAAPGVAPHDRRAARWPVLVKKMPLAAIVQQAVGIIHPAGLGGEMKLRTERFLEQRVGVGDQTLRPVALDKMLHRNAPGRRMVVHADIAVPTSSPISQVRQTICGSELSVAFAARTTRSLTSSSTPTWPGRLRSPATRKLRKRR